jgi:uncharacterized UPF0160 family protein
MKYNKIITHAGTHHADEVLAIATVLHFVGEIPVERRYTATKEEMEDPSVIILDIMREHQPELSNFDHHQDSNVQATNILVLDQFCQDEFLRNELKDNLFNYVDAVDRGHVIETSKTIQPTFNSLIRALNSAEDGFYKALSFARISLDGLIASAEQKRKTEKLWNSIEKKDGVAINLTSDYIIDWKERAANEGVYIMISPNPRQVGSFQATVISTDVLTIPAHKDQSFLHANGFTASYNTLESAIAHSKELVKDLI